MNFTNEYTAKLAISPNHKGGTTIITYIHFAYESELTALIETINNSLNVTAEYVVWDAENYEFVKAK